MKTDIIDITYTPDIDALKSTAEAGDSAAQFKLAQCYLYGIHTQVNDCYAIHWLKQSAYKQYAPAENQLAWCYANGIGVEKDISQAAKWSYSATIHDLPTQHNNTAPKH